MIFTGSFNTYDNQYTYNVTIGSIGVTNIITDPIDIDEDSLLSNGPTVMFDPNPVSINCDREDLIKRVIISQATINLIAAEDVSAELYALTGTDIPVSITLGSNQDYVFFGYVDPLMFNQGYARNYESVQITATDPLGKLEMLKVDDVSTFYTTSGSTPIPTEMTPWDVIEDILDKINVTVGIERINATVKTAMQNTKLHMKVFFGDDRDDYKTLYEVLDEICKYFNLYISMYDADTVIISCTINNAPGQENINFKDSATDDSTSIGYDDVFNQIELTCKIEPVKDIFTQLDDKDNMYSDYLQYEKYMTEYESPDAGMTSWDTFYKMINEQSDITYDEAWTRDHYCYVLRNDLWDFGTGTDKSYIEYLGGGYNAETGAPIPMYKGQCNIMNWLHGRRMRAAFVALGSTDKVMANGQVTDDSIKSNITLDKYLIISTLGKFKNDLDELNAYRTQLSPYYDSPLCTFKGIDRNILSPADSQVTNYLIISGNIILNPLQKLCGSNWSDDEATLSNTFANAKSYYIYSMSNMFARQGVFRTVDCDTDDDGCYYQQRWMWWDSNTGYSEYNNGILGVYGPLDRKCSQMFKYEYSEDHSTNDQISKMPIICCRLKVGEGNDAKYCVERLDGGTPVHSWGETGENRFEWLTAAEASAKGISPTFTIGINPKIGDTIIGPKWQISNTVRWDMNLDKTGMAIPIKEQDHLDGPIEFSILGPYNATWEHVTKYYHGYWFWEHAGYRVNTKSILSNTQSIMINNLKIEMTSNNGGVNSLKTTADNDLVYKSAMAPSFNENQEVDLSICTALTFEECQEWGIKNQTTNSYVYNLDNSGYRGFGGTVKPEVCLVDYLYKEMCTPSKVLDTQLKATAFDNGLYGNQMNYDMLCNYFVGVVKVNGSYVNTRIMSYETNLKKKTIDVKFREHKTVTNYQI